MNLHFVKKQYMLIDWTSNTRDVAALLEKDAAGQSELGTVTSCTQAEAISYFFVQNGSRATFEVL